MTTTYQRPEDLETWQQWIDRRTSEENRWVCFAFYRDGELVCTREAASKAAKDFSEAVKTTPSQWEVVAERRDGSTLTMAARYPGTGCICGTPWFLRAAGL
jgi:hypothetical protein